MADLPSLLLASLHPDTRKQAEHNLNAFSTQQGFLSHLLRLILESSQDRAVRLSGSVYLKNITKLRWDEVRLTYCIHGRHALTSMVAGRAATGRAGQRIFAIRTGPCDAGPFKPRRQGYPCTGSRVCLLDCTTRLSGKVDRSHRCAYLAP